MSNKTSKLPVLISFLFLARTEAHQFHLQSRSYAQHMALGSYYDEIASLADDLAENYQGRYGIIEKFPKVTLNPTSPIKLVETIRSWIDENRGDCCEDSEIQNIIDEVQALNNSTIYKLKFLS